MKQFHIYTLSDPRDGVVRYVGCTIDPKARLSAHLCDKANTRKNKWLDELKENSLIPVINIVSAVGDAISAAREEQRVYAIHSGSALLCANPNVISYHYTEREKLPIMPIRMDDELYEKAARKAKSLGLSFAAYVRMLISKDI